MPTEGFTSQSIYQPDHGTNPGYDWQLLLPQRRSENSDKHRIRLPYIPDYIAVDPSGSASKTLRIKFIFDPSVVEKKLVFRIVVGR
jgi:hypothetical protein